MISSKFTSLNAVRCLLTRALGQQSNRHIVRQMGVSKGTHHKSGALKPKPETMPFGIVVALCTVVPGLFVGATISKNVAYFLEENELFVVSDEDDDD